MNFFQMTACHYVPAPITKFDFERAQLRFASKIRTEAQNAIDRERYVSFCRYLLGGDLVALQLAIRSYSVDAAKFRKMIDTISAVLSGSGVSLHCNFIPRSTATTAQYVAVLTIASSDFKETLLICSDLTAGRRHDSTKHGVRDAAVESCERIMTDTSKKIIRFFNTNGRFHQTAGAMQERRI